jgi:SAM-dependent methyltransferase
MSEAAFAERTCPACGGGSPAGEIRSARRAQDATPDALRPFWSGLFKEKLFFSYARCGTCALLYAPTYFTAEQLTNLYSSMAPNMDLLPRAALEATQRGYFDAVKAEALSGDYLEIGPDVGYLARHAARTGAFNRFWLFEPNLGVHAQLSEAVGGAPHSVVADMADISSVPDGSVGLAVMVHVLDHLIDPMATLTEIHRKLRPGGLLMTVTHNEASLLRWAMGRQWPPFCLQHPELYSPASIRQLLKRANFLSVRVARSRNYFPIAFMARQAAWRFGLNLDKVPLPSATLGLKLGNMITVARR